MDGRSKKRSSTVKSTLNTNMQPRIFLTTPNVPEEHRSNVLGQIWAKGERQGIDECLEFIESKEAELILPEDVGEQLRDLSSE